MIFWERGGWGIVTKQSLTFKGVANANFSSFFVNQRKSLIPFQKAKREQPLAEGFPTVLNVDSENGVTRQISANKKYFLLFFHSK